MEFVTRLQYEYAEVAVDLFYENLTCPLFGGGLHSCFAIFLVS